MAFARHVQSPRRPNRRGEPISVPVRFAQIPPNRAVEKKGQFRAVHGYGNLPVVASPSFTFTHGAGPPPPPRTCLQLIRRPGETRAQAGRRKPTKSSRPPKAQGACECESATQPESRPMRRRRKCPSRSKIESGGSGTEAVRPAGNRLEENGKRGTRKSTGSLPAVRAGTFRRAQLFTVMARFRRASGGIAVRGIRFSR